MSIAANQHRTFLRLVAALRARWRTDPVLPAFIQSLLARDRTFGARDRRLYRELIYTTLRYLPWIEPLLDRHPEEAIRRVAWLAAETPATQSFRAAFATGTPPEGDRTELLPAWFRDHCPEIFVEPELSAQLRRAPLWLRLQTDAPQRVFPEFEQRGWRSRPSALLPGAVEVLDDADVTQTEAFRRGSIEIQDLGSQLILEAIGLESGGRWLDACAGAGGKSLQLAQLLGPTGTVEAHDIRPAALDELAGRARRAGIPVAAPPNRGRNTRAKPSPDSNGPDTSGPLPHSRSASITISDSPSALSSSFDGVLIDAPCSGAGTWRRAPHLKWVTTPELIEKRAHLQQSLLARFAQCVRPGGRLVYATCSLSSRENEDIVNRFLADRPEFQPEPFARTFGATPRGTSLLILPGLHDTDGFFVASLRRTKR